MCAPVFDKKKLTSINFGKTGWKPIMKMYVSPGLPSIAKW